MALISPRLFKKSHSLLGHFLNATFHSAKNALTGKGLRPFETPRKAINQQQKSIQKVKIWDLQYFI